jgi:ribosome-binding protein aMBF1 (putative translation factor)
LQEKISAKIVCTRWPLFGETDSWTLLRAQRKEGREPNEEALVERLRQFVENSDLSFYRIASRIGTSGGILSMWLAGKARPRAEELAAIEKFLKG